MDGDKELLGYIYENASMGEDALKTMLMSLEKSDNKIKSNVTKSLECYRAVLKDCKKLMSKYKANTPTEKFMAKLMTKMGTKMEFMRDNSDTKLADTLIQGYNMSIIDMTKKINKYKGNVSKEVLHLAENYKKMMQEGQDSVKGFL